MTFSAFKEPSYNFNISFLLNFNNRETDDVVIDARSVTGKHLCQSLFFNKAAGLRSETLFKKKTLVQMFSCDFCEILNGVFLQI